MTATWQVVAPSIVIATFTFQRLLPEEQTHQRMFCYNFIDLIETFQIYFFNLKVKPFLVILNNVHFTCQVQSHLVVSLRRNGTQPLPRLDHSSFMAMTFEVSALEARIHVLVTCIIFQQDFQNLLPYCINFKLHCCHSVVHIRICEY